MADTNLVQKEIALLRGLRAIRQFRPDPVPQEIVDELINIARWSGSASNNQPWEIVVIRNPETRKALAQAEGYASHLAGAPLGILIVLRGEAGRETQETFDEGRLSERLMLAAAAYGLGSCIGWFVGNGGTTVKKALGIPADRVVRTVISIGYADEEALRARPKRINARKPVQDLVHLERYS
jgi:nitroreductase